MNLSKRERYIAVGVAAVVAILVLDQLVLGPMLSHWDDLKKQITATDNKIADANRLFARSRTMSRKWSEMVSVGLKRDASEAESQVLHSVRDWAQEAGMTLTSLKPERNEREKGFHKITFRATGAGQMQQIGRFLWKIQTAAIPVSVSDVQISARKEGTDDLAIQLGISTIYQSAESEKPEKPEKGAKASVAMAREVMP